MTKGYFEFEYLKRRDLNDEVQKVVQNYLNIYNSLAGTVDYFANLPSASANLNKIWLVRFATTFLGIITKQAGLYISDGTNWNWMTSLEAKADKNILISAGNGLTGGGDLSANRTISHSDTSSQVNVVNTGGNVIQSANLDDFGHITSFSSIDLDNRYIITSGAYANPTWITSLGANKLTGTIPSNVLSGSTLYIGTTAIALNRASGNQALTGISSVQFTGSTSGTATLQAPAVAGTTTFNLPATSGNLIGNADVGTVTNTMLAAITTAGKVANSSTSAVSTNTVNTIVLRDASGNFNASKVTLSDQLVLTRTNNSGTGSSLGQLSLEGTVGNRIDFNSNGVAAPNNVTRSVGTKIVLYPAMGTGNADYGLGIDTSTLWQSVPSNTAGFKWYANTTQIASLSGAGVLTASSFAGSLSGNADTATLIQAGNADFYTNTLPANTGATDTYIYVGRWNTTQTNEKLSLKILYNNSLLTDTRRTSEYMFFFNTSNGIDFSAGSTSNFYGWGRGFVLGEGGALDSGNTRVIQVSNTQYDFYIRVLTGVTSGTGCYVVNTSGGSWSHSGTNFGSTIPTGNSYILYLDNILTNYTNVNFFNIEALDQITASKTWDSGNDNAAILMNGDIGSRIEFKDLGSSAPTLTTRSVGSKIVLRPTTSATLVDYGIGIETSSMWFSVSSTSDQHSFYAGTTKIARIRNEGIRTRAILYQGNAAFTALNTTATLTIAQILTLVIESTPTANITFTLPTGTNTDAGVMSSLETFASFTWSIVNIATGFTITMAGNTGNTYIGNTTIAANTSATFRTQKTAANTFKTVRI